MTTIGTRKTKFCDLLFRNLTSFTCYLHGSACIILITLIGWNICLTTERFPEASGAYTCFCLYAMWFVLQETEGFVCVIVCYISIVASIRICSHFKCKSMSDTLGFRVIKCWGNFSCLISGTLWVIFNNYSWYLKFLFKYHIKLQIVVYANYFT